jgi:predicted phage baseplate assembly protein
MPLPAVNLDDRTFQDIVDEARTLIPRYCPEWTDHNLSDPGITLVELFAWMTELTLFRLNQVPDRNYVKFLDLMGVKLLEPRPARTDVSFRLTASQPNRVVIPLGTEVATVRTESQDAISFTTDRDLNIEVATLREAFVTRDGQSFFDLRAALSRGTEVAIFADTPAEGNAIYIGHVELLAGRRPARPAPYLAGVVGGRERLAGLRGRVGHHRRPQPRRHRRHPHTHGGVDVRGQRRRGLLGAP